MGSKVETCAECKKKCLLCHVKKRNSAPLVSSFFKVMIAERFSEVLFLPPKLAPTVSTLIDQEIPLEDSSGQEWKVKLTIKENSVALYQGWDKFAVDHGLQIGDLLIFHYILGSHFVVQIFDKTGCEKLNFSGNKNLRKRAEADGKSTKRSRPSCSTGKGSMGKQGSNSSPSLESNDVQNIIMPIVRSSSNKNEVAGPRAVCGAEFFEEPCSSVKVSKDNLDNDGKNKIPVGAKRSSHNLDISLKTKTKAGLDGKGTTNQLPLLASMSSLQLNKNLGSKSSWSNGVHSKCQPDKGTKMSQSRKKQNVIDMEQDDRILMLPTGSNDKVDGEMMLVTTNTSPNSGSISCLITANSRPFLELPTGFPSNKRGTGKERRLVYLKGPDMKQWPVLYNETPKLKLFMSGWQAFCQANNIQPGDECSFRIENETERIFRVSIFRRSIVG